MDWTTFAQTNYLNVKLFRRCVLSGAESRVLTIRSLTQEEMFNPNQRQMNIKPVIYFNEFEKPIVGTRPVLNDLDEIFGSIDDVENWIGQKAEWYILEVKGRQPSIRCRRASTHVDPNDGDHPIGFETAERVNKRLLELGLSIDGFLHWLKNNNQPMHRNVYGVEISDWPRSCLDNMKIYTEEESAEEGE